MGKFNTHGGYFSPQGYLRIDAGGSHDENPNGGVQLGKDPQGIPNMLEENEPVYNDFVYSDNIIASKDMLKKHKLPEKYAGKLFSEIADKFVDEAAIRPNDRVSNNGLNKMLVRLADAQEEQKAVEEQEELEEELAQLSPEEQQAVMQQVMAQQQAMPQEAIAADPAAQQMAAQQQVMANGGLLRKFEDGTPGAVVAEDGTQQNLQDGYLQGAMYNPSSQPTLILDPNTGNYYAAGAKPQGQSFTLPLTEVVTENPDAVDEIYYGGSIQPSVAVAFPGKSQAWVDAEVGPRSIKKQVGQSRDEFLADAYDMYNDNLPAQILLGTPGAAISAVGELANGNYTEAGLLGLVAGGSAYGKLAKGVTTFAGKQAAKRAASKAAKAATKTASSDASAALSKLSTLTQDIKDATELVMKDPTDVTSKRLLDNAIKEYDALRKSIPSNVWTKVSAPFKSAVESAKGAVASAKQKVVEGVTGIHPSAGATSSAASGATSSAASQATKPWYKTGKGWGRAAASVLGTGAAATGIGYGIDAIVDSKGAETDYGDWSQYIKAQGGPIHRFDDAGKMVRATNWAQNMASGNLPGALYSVAGQQPVATVIAGQSQAPHDTAAAPAVLPAYLLQGQIPGMLYSAPDSLRPYDVPVPLRPDYVEDAVTSVQPATHAKASTVVATTQPQAVTTSAAPAVKNQRTAFVPISDETKQAIDGLRAALPGAKHAEGLAPIPESAKWTKEKRDAWLKQLEDEAATEAVGNSQNPLQTASRYAGLGIDAAGMLYNAFQQPTKFTARPYSPVLNYGTMPLTNPVYNPLDVNMTLNDVLASSAGNARQIVNAGQGPSTGASLLSNGYNTGKNIGNARIAVADANNQRYNDVITRRNANAQAQAQFQAGLGQRRADAINKAALRNQQTDLTLQRLNDVSETGKFTTLGQYSDSIKNALAGIGTENLRLNNLNNTPGRYYDLTQNGLVFYNPDANPEHSRGGLLKNYKKRK